MCKERNEDAVSEVIASVLMVALVVILAAIIGSMIFGLVGPLQKTKVVGVTATRFNATNISVTYDGGQDSNQLYQLDILINGAAIKSLYLSGGTIPLDVGNSTLVAGPSPGKDRVVIVGLFMDGTKQVVLDTTV